MVKHDNDKRFWGDIDLSRKLFMELCDKNDGDGKYELETLDVDEDKMRCHVLDCLTALHKVQREKRIREISSGDKKYELAKRRVFSSAISMIMDDEESVGVNYDILNSYLPSVTFP